MDTTSDISNYWKDIDADNKIFTHRQNNEKITLTDKIPIAPMPMNYRYLLILVIRDTNIRYYTMRNYFVTPTEPIALATLNNGINSQKLSKTIFPNPDILIDTYGPDVLRLYLLSIKITKRSKIYFSEKILIALHQKYVKLDTISKFLTDKINRYNYNQQSMGNMTVKYPSTNDLLSCKHILDKWILDTLGLFRKRVYDKMNNRQTNSMAEIVVMICNFIDQTDWYITMAKDRLKGITSKFSIQKDWREAIQTLLFVVDKFTICIAPFMPFVSEKIYLMLKSYKSKYMESVHFEFFPTNNTFVYYDLEYKFIIIKRVMALINKIKQETNKRIVAYAKISSNNWRYIADVVPYICNNCGVLNIEKLDIEDLVEYRTSVNFVNLKKFLKDNEKINLLRQVTKFILGMKQDQIKILRENGSIAYLNLFYLNSSHINIVYEIKNEMKYRQVEGDCVVELDPEYSDEIKCSTYISQINNAILTHRKKLYNKADINININFYTTNLELRHFIPNNINYENINQISFSVIKNKLYKKSNWTSHRIMDIELLIGSQSVS